LKVTLKARRWSSGRSEDREMAVLTQDLAFGWSRREPV
jgi:hypothetical protein